ncbi:MAG: protease modulator HflC [Paracoccaceae bacterium]
MRGNKSIYLIVIALLAIFLVRSSVFIVDEREKGLILQFGRVVDVKEEPGLAFKIPFIQEVVRYDDRILSRDVDPLEVTPLDDRRLVVDAFARYRITDVERFRQAVGAGGIESAARRLDSILRAETREVLGSVSSNDILSTDRAALMLRIRNAAIAEANALGLTIIDVRLKRTDLPPENLNATFERMIAERNREAADERARGAEAAQRTLAAAERTAVELTSDAQRQAEITRGEADARRNNIFASSFGADPEFFEFYRSMIAYQRSLTPGNSTMVLSPDNEFFNYLRNDDPFDANGGSTPAAAPADDAAPAEDTPAEGDTSDDAGLLTVPEAETAPAGADG